MTPANGRALPEKATQLFDQGNAFLAAGELDAARRCFTRVLALAPEVWEARFNLCLLDERCGRDLEAAHGYLALQGLLPDEPVLLGNLGAVLQRLHRFAEAEAVLRRATDLAPHDARLWANLGGLYVACWREGEAESCLVRALDLNPGDRAALNTLGTLRLRQGRWREGLEILESRPGWETWEAQMPCPRWQGQPLTGQRVLLVGEGGLGDVIMLARYAAVLKARGAEYLILICQPALVRLLRTVAGLDEVYALDQAGSLPPDWDFWVPMMSLMHGCASTPATIPQAIPYLHPDPSLVRVWEARLSPWGTDLQRVGLVVQGDPRRENDAWRSIYDTQALALLARRPGVLWVLLQPEEVWPAWAEGLEGSSELGAGPGLTRRPGRSGLVIGGKDLADLADTAALIACLDLVIAVDTAVAHLAGALGKPCWLLLAHHGPDWRWLTHPTETAWYPNTRLVRQGPEEAWAPILEQVGDWLSQGVGDGLSQRGGDGLSEGLSLDPDGGWGRGSGAVLPGKEP